jgi:hypothetical protein
MFCLCTALLIEGYFKDV